MMSLLTSVILCVVVDIFPAARLHHTSGELVTEPAMQQVLL